MTPGQTLNAITLGLVTFLVGALVATWHERRIGVLVLRAERLRVSAFLRDVGACLRRLPAPLDVHDRLSGRETAADLARFLEDVLLAKLADGAHLPERHRGHGRAYPWGEPIEPTGCECHGTIEEVSCKLHGCGWCRDGHAA